MPSNQEQKRAEGRGLTFADPCVQTTVKIFSVWIIHFQVLNYRRCRDTTAENLQGVDMPWPPLEEGSGITSAFVPLIGIQEGEVSPAAVGLGLWDQGSIEPLSGPQHWNDGGANLCVILKKS